MYPGLCFDFFCFLHLKNTRMAIKIAARPNITPNAPPRTARVFAVEGLSPPPAAAAGVDVVPEVAVGVTTDTDGSDDVEVCNGTCAAPPSAWVAFSQEFSFESNITIGFAEFPPVIARIPSGESAI
jgi:hypothetical protein